MDDPHVEVEIKPQLKLRGSVAKEDDPKRSHQLCSSVQFSHSVMSDSLQPHGLQHARLPCPSPTPGVTGKFGLGVRNEAGQRLIEFFQENALVIAIILFQEHKRRLLRVPWTARRSNQSIVKEISLEYSLEGLMLKLKLKYFGHLMM